MSIPFYPPAISTCVLWLDASDPTSLTTAAGRVTAWNDKTQFSNNTRVVSAQGPLLSNINSLSSLFFQGASGAAQFFQGPLSSFSTLALFSTPFLNMYLTTFAVGTVEAPSVTGYFPNFVGAGFRTSFYPGTQLVQWSTPQANIAVYPNATSNSNYAALPAFSQPFLIANSAYFNASTSYTYLNTNGYPTVRSDGRNALNTLPTSTLGAYSIGGSLSATTDFRNSWTGHISEVIMYATSNQLSWSQRQVIEGYLASKWGVQSSLPPYHPYKNTPIFISSPTSAMYIVNSNVNKNVILPATNTLSTQLIWAVPQTQQSNMSSVSYIGPYNEPVDSNISVVLNQTAQSALLVNNPGQSNWLLHSISKNNLLFTAQNVNLNTYTAYPRATRSGTGTIGHSVAISSNGNYILAGDGGYDIPLTNCGALFMFIRNPTSDLYSTFQTYISPSTTQALAGFGSRVAMTDDATYIVGSGSNFNSPTISDVGYVSIFKKSAATDFWSFTQQLNPPSSDFRTGLGFGTSLKITANGDYIFAGGKANYAGTSLAGAVYPFKKRIETDFWDPLPPIYPPVAVTLNSGFGNNIDITSDAGYLVIACSNFAYSGTAGSLFFYKKDAITDQWNFTQQILPSDYNEGPNNFGYATAISRNSNYLVGTTRDGNNYVYKKDTLTDFWNFSYILYNHNPLRMVYFGEDCSISENGEYILISGEGDSLTDRRGTCIMYQKQMGTDIWQNTNFFYPSDINIEGPFGASIDITPSAEQFVVGNPSGTTALQGIFVYKQSTIGETGTVNASNSFICVNTTAPTKTILLPHPSSNPGQMIYIKDGNQQSFYSPIRISTTSNSFINSTISKFSFFQNNACLQLQSDGNNQYTILNYFAGNGGLQSSIYEFQSFWIKGTTVGAVNNYPIPISVDYNSNLSVNNYFFLDSDNNTPIPFWNESGNTNCNIFWVNITDIPPSPMAKQYFLYWNSNSVYVGNPNNVFSFYDDFSGPSNSTPESNKWFVTKQGSASAQATLTGFTDSVILMGVSNTNANANLLTRNSYLSTNFSICFNATLSASTFATVAFATTSTQQFLTTGGQSNWWWTSIGNGYTLAFSSINRRFCYAQAENAAPITLGCNVGTWAQANTYDYQFSYLSNGRIAFSCNAAFRGTKTSIFSFTDTTYLNSNKYLFIGQGSISNLPARSTILNNVFIRKYVEPEPTFSGYGNINVL